MNEYTGGTKIRSSYPIREQLRGSFLAICLAVCMLMSGRLFAEGESVLSELLYKDVTALPSFGKIEWDVGALPFVGPGPRGGISGMAMVAHDGQVYLAGGFIPIGDETTDPSRRTSRWTYRYTPQTKVWKRLDDMPGRREYVRGIASDGAIYVVGGAEQMPGSTPAYMAKDDCFKLDVSTLTWTNHSRLTVPRTHIAVGDAGNGNLVVIGGNEYTLPGGYVHSTIRDTVDVMNVSDKSPEWRARTPIPNGSRGWMASAVCNGRIYCFGGLTFPKVGARIRYQETLSYDPASDSWAEHTPPPVPVAGWEGAVFMDRYIIIVGGTIDVGGTPLWNDMLFVYDTVDDRWYGLDAPLPSEVKDHMNDPGVCIIDDKIYVAGAEGPDCSHFNDFLIGKIIPRLSTRLE